MRILLACCQGISTSIVVTKMQEAAKSQGEDHKIWAVESSQVEEQQGEFDVLLLGPQIRHMLKRMQRTMDNKVPVDVINAADYGRCNGAAVLAQAKKMYEDFYK